MKIKFEKDFSIYKKDQVIRVDCDGSDIPTEIYWRRRIKDHTCIVYHEVKKNKKTKTEYFKNKGESS